MNQPTLIPLVASSTDPTQVANWIKGILMTSSGAILLFILTVFHINISPTTFDAWAAAISMLGGSIWAIYGLLHHGVATLGRAKNSGATN